MSSWLLTNSNLSTGDAASKRRYTLWNVITLALYAITLLAILNAAILALAWSKQPFLGFVVEPTLVVSNVAGVSWNAQQIGLNYPERVIQIGDRVVNSSREFLDTTAELYVGEPISVRTIFPDQTQRVYPSVRVTAFPSADLLRFFWLPILVGLAYLAIGFWTYRMRGDIAPSHAFAYFGISAALATGLYFDLVSTHVLSAIWTVGIAFLGGTLIVLALVFPAEWSDSKRFNYLIYLPYAVSLGLAIWGVYALAGQSDPWAYVNPWRFSYIFAAMGIFFFIAMMVYRGFTNPSAETRQQARIVLWGSLFAFLPVAVWMVAPFLGFPLPWNPGLFLPFLLIFPLAIAIAILRYRLWDIDVIVNRTLVYGLLILVMALLYFATIIILQRTFESLTGETSDLAAVVSTLVIVILFVPVRGYVQNFVDRRFYRTKYDAVKTIESFSDSLRDEVDLEFVLRRLESVIEETVLPTQISSWLRTGDEFEVYLTQGRELEDGFESQQGDIHISLDDPLLEYFRDSPGTMDLEQLEIDTESHEKMVASGIKMVVPLITQGELTGWLGLGNRMSGQKYSTDDQLLLSRLAVQVAPTVRVAHLVAKQQAEAVERERIEQELLVARRIQNALLPKELPKLDGWGMAAYYQPARVVGGDFYDFKHFSDGRLGIFIGDVTDKGIPAAIVMATTRTLLQAIAHESISTGEVLARVNNLLEGDIPENMFVTCFYAILDPHSGKLEFSNAGHNLPYLQNGAKLKELKAAGMPLGLIADVEYDIHETIVDPGSCIIFYSDGLVEAHDEQREMFGSNRLMNSIAEISSDGEVMIEKLLKELHTFTGDNWEQEDDITIVWVKRYNSPEVRSED
jgi:serine phosphatase RsbU (regulator of sigma subunit)